MSTTPRLTITLPPDLHVRLKAVREHLSVSRICQEVIDRAVTQQELRLEASTDREDLVERLRLEKEEYDQRFYDTGYKQGLADAKGLSYEQLIEVVSGSERLYKTIAWDQVLKDRLDTGYQEDDQFNQEMYVGGWSQGVREFWDSIKDEL